MNGAFDLKSPPDKEDLGGFPYIPYNANNTELAKENRKKPTKAERIMWNEVLRNRKLNGIKFHRQKPLDEYIADFYSSELMLVIEIDGESHSVTEVKENDVERTLILNSYEIKVVRYTNNDVQNNLPEVRKDLINKIRERKNELNN